ncbi:Actin-7 [Sesbania bispinosa]|nr:Actin-7 [Sesbania bispinosa]
MIIKVVAPPERRCGYLRVNPLSIEIASKSKNDALITMLPWIRGEIGSLEGIF